MSEAGYVKDKNYQFLLKYFPGNIMPWMKNSLECFSPADTGRIGIALWAKKSNPRIPEKIKQIYRLIVL